MARTAASTPETTTLDADVTKPSVTGLDAAGTPADTTDPAETAHSVPARPGPEAIAAGTVNAVVPGKPLAEAAAPEGGGRVEQYKATKPDGTEVTVEHNIDTGESKVA